MPDEKSDKPIYSAEIVTGVLKVEKNSPIFFICFRRVTNDNSLIAGNYAEDALLNAIYSVAQAQNFILSENDSIKNPKLKHEGSLHTQDVTQCVMQYCENKSFKAFLKSNIKVPKLLLETIVENESQYIFLLNENGYVHAARKFENTTINIMLNLIGGAAVCSSTYFDNESLHSKLLECTTQFESVFKPIFLFEPLLLKAYEKNWIHLDMIQQFYHVANNNGQSLIPSYDAWQREFIVCKFSNIKLISEGILMHLNGHDTQNTLHEQYVIMPYLSSIAATRIDLFPLLFFIYGSRYQSDNPSPLRVLPMEIIEKIFLYVVIDNAKKFDCLKFSEAYFHRMFKLLSDFALSGKPRRWQTDYVTDDNCKFTIFRPHNKNIDNLLDAIQSVESARKMPNNN